MKFTNTVDKKQIWFKLRYFASDIWQIVPIEKKTKILKVILGNGNQTNAIVNAAKTFFIPSLRYLNLFGFFKFRSNHKEDDLLNCAPKIDRNFEGWLWRVYLFIYLF